MRQKKENDNHFYCVLPVTYIFYVRDFDSFVAINVVVSVTITAVTRICTSSY